MWEICAFYGRRRVSPRSRNPLRRGRPSTSSPRPPQPPLHVDAPAHSHHLKRTSLPWLQPQVRLGNGKISTAKLRMPSQSLFNKSVALLFNKRSTRTRVAAETAALLLGGQTLFLGKEDIQIGINETVRDSARVIGGMCQGIFARVGAHEEIEVRWHVGSWACIH